MPINSGFFDAIDGDRVYNADSINSFFEGFVTDGVLSPVGDFLDVTALDPPSMAVNVGSGKAWFLNTWLTNTTSKTLTVEPSDNNYSRVDIVAMDFDKNNRANTLIVLTGEPSPTPSPPTLIETAYHLQVPLALLYISAQDTEVTNSIIQNKIGTEDCPFCTGLLQQATTDELLTSWDAQFQEWMAQVEADLLEIDTSGTLAELEDMRDRTEQIHDRNMIVNGDLYVNQLGITTVSNYDRAASIAAQGRPGIADHWWFLVGLDGGTWQLQRRDRTRRYGYLATVTALGGTDPSRYVCFEQRIESSLFYKVNKGRNDPYNNPVILTWSFKTNTAGTYIVELIDEVNSRSISKAITHVGNNTFADYSWAIPADYTGEIPNDESWGLTLRFWLSAGSDYTAGTLRTTWGDMFGTNINRAVGQTNLLSAVNNSAEITSVQLEIGSVASNYARLPYHIILEKCKRYLEYHAQFYASGLVTTSALKQLQCLDLGTWDVPKRGIPEVTAASGTIYSVTGGTYTFDDILYIDTYDHQRYRPALVITSTTDMVGGAINRAYLNDLIVDSEF